MRKFYLITLLTACLAVTKAPACTTFLLTNGATKDGSTMITYAADSHVLYGELYHWPAGTWAEGTMMDIYEWDTGKYMGQIPQASQTYNVIGNMNEFQLARALRRMIVTSDGRAMGTSMRQRKRQLLETSMRAE